MLGCYRAGAIANSRGKCTEDIDGRIEPLFGPSIATPRLNKLLKLVIFFQNGENGTGRVAGFELGSQLMREKVILRLLFVTMQSSIENRPKIRRGRGGSREGGLGHRADGLVVECK